MFTTFVSVADRILEAIQPAGGATISEPQQQVRRVFGIGRRACNNCTGWDVQPAVHACRSSRRQCSSR
jgi:protein involved in polysaccharide export with SLBB domain